MTTVPTIAVLGLGEAGSRLAADLVAAGVEVRGFDPDAARDVPGTVRAADAETAVAGCDVVLERELGRRRPRRRGRRAPRTRAETPSTPT